MEDEGGPVWERLLLGYALAMLIVNSYGENFVALVDFFLKNGRGIDRSMNLREICAVINTSFENVSVDANFAAQAIKVFGSPPE